MHSHETEALNGRGGTLPWLRARWILAAVIVLCLPYLLVTVPPLVDLPGHLGAAAIEAAPHGSPLRDFWHWEWHYSLNMGGEVLMKLLADAFGLMAAGWWSAVIITAVFAAGCLATIRALNPQGGYGAFWALIFVFSYPLLMGFLNFVLATGLTLLAFAAWLKLERRGAARVALLLFAQPLLLTCHAVGGALLPLLIGAHALGEVLDRREPWRAALRTLIVRCWPLGMTLLTLAAWKSIAPAGRGGLKWDASDKLLAFPFALRDQSLALDAATLTACFAVLIVGAAIGARWSWRQGLPALAVAVLFVIAPGAIDGSALVDTRLLPVALMLALGLQDWSGVSRRAAQTVALAGLALVTVRLGFTAHGFAAYDADYQKQLAALDRVEQGAKVLTLVEHTCLRESWRLPRTDHVASLASVYRGAWTNDNWAVPGLHMLRPKFRPARRYTADPSTFVWSRGCSGGVRLRGIDSAMRKAPLDKVDYVWLIDTGAPREEDPRLAEVWRSGESVLYAVRARTNVLGGQAMAKNATKDAAKPRGRNKG